jgi:hypothetical protein
MDIEAPSMEILRCSFLAAMAQIHLRKHPVAAYAPQWFPPHQSVKSV